MLGKLNFVKITLILRKFMMTAKRKSHLSEVEKANIICKVRALVGQDLRTFSKNLDLTEGVLRSLEDADYAIPDSVMHRISAMIGIQPQDLMGKRMNDLMKELDIGILSQIFPSVPRHEIFDLIFYYDQIEQEQHREKMFGVLKLLSQPLPTMNKSKKV